MCDCSQSVRHSDSSASTRTDESEKDGKEEEGGGVFNGLTQLLRYRPYRDRLWQNQMLASRARDRGVTINQTTQELTVTERTCCQSERSRDLTERRSMRLRVAW